MGLTYQYWNHIMGTKKNLFMEINTLTEHTFLCLLSDDCELDHRRMDNVINEFVENAPIKGIKIKYGIYKNVDKNLSITTICDYASMAAETVMEDYNRDYAYYTDELAQKRLYNQMIENDFTDALKNKERLV